MNILFLIHNKMAEKHFITRQNGTIQAEAKFAKAIKRFKTIPLLAKKEEEAHDNRLQALQKMELVNTGYRPYFF
jgi:hypothetical protein